MCPCAMTRLLSQSVFSREQVPSVHIPLNFEEILEFVAIRLPRSSFKHVSAILGVKSGDILLGSGSSTLEINMSLRYCFLETGYSTTGLLQLFIIGQFFQDLILSQTQSSVSIFMIIRNDHILHLDKISPTSTWRNSGVVPHLPTRAHPSPCLLQLSKYSKTAISS